MKVQHKTQFGTTAFNSLGEAVVAAARPMPYYDNVQEQVNNLVEIVEQLVNLLPAETQKLLMTAYHLEAVS